MVSAQFIYYIEVIIAFIFSFFITNSKKDDIVLLFFTIHLLNM